MAKSYVTLSPVLNIPLPSRLYTTLYITHLKLHSHLFTFTFSIPNTPSDTENYLSIENDLTIQILQTLWFLTMIVQNNIICDNLI